jgi:hypothetical protein
MANLRGLLGKEFASTLNATVGEFGALDKNNNGRVYLFHPYCNNGNCESNYWEYCNYWCAPCGTTHVTFELWGGGGSGAGACCCMQGIPGGAGAYVRKTLQFPLVQGGWCYTLCVASPTCCASCCCGIKGCKSWVTGCNLTNLCAEGGLPGKTCCYAYWSTEFRCKDKVAFTGCGGYDLKTDCACAYGGDYMVGGKPGWFRTFNTSSNCFAKVGLPFPAGLISQQPGYITSNIAGNACLNHWTYCFGTTPWAFNANCNGGPGVPGVGAPSSTACGGGCCYGWRGGGGLIKVTYCSCWIQCGNSDCAFHYFN